MSYTENSIFTANITMLDAFGNLKVSNPFTLFDAKQIHDNLPLHFDDQETSGSGTSSTFVIADAKSVLAVANLTAGKRVRQSFRCLNYQPGKSQEIAITGNINDKESGITKQVGYFEDDNGIFFEASDDFYFGIRKNGVDRKIAIADWTFNGVAWADSGYTMDFTKVQIFIFDMEWLGVGSVRFGFQLDGLPVYAHAEHHANTTYTDVYMQSPNLPIRYSIENDGTGGISELDTICCVVKSAGGQQEAGQTRAIDRGTTSFSTGNNTSIHPLLSFRLRSGWEGATINTIKASIICTSNADFRWVLIVNPTIAGVDAVSWVTLSDAAIEYDISRTNVNTLSGGFQLISGYGNKASDIVTPATISTIRPGVAIDGTADEFILAVQNMSSINETYYASLVIQES